MIKETKDVDTEIKTAKQLLDEKMIKEKKRRNIELYTLYRIFSFDLFFYYAIIYLFLTIQKGLTPAQVLMFDAFYMFFRFIMQIPSTILIKKIGKRRSIVLASFINLIHIVIIMLAQSFSVLLISQLLCAFGFIIKATCETDMLYDSLKHGEKRGSTFAKIDGRAVSIHYYFEGISSALAGFLYIVNPYLPMILCFLVLLIDAIISINFESIEEIEKTGKIIDEYRKIKKSFKDIFKSRRLVSLLCFNALMIAMIKIFQNVRNVVLIDLQIPIQYFGIIYATLEIIAGIASKFQNKIHNKYRNKTLTALGMPTAISFLIIGIILSIELDFKIKLGIIIIMFITQYVARGPYYVLIKRYLNNFTNSKKRVEIATANNYLENLIVSILMFCSAFVLDKLPINFTLIVVGCVAIMLSILLLDAMRTTVGLKPELYSKRDIG